MRRLFPVVFGFVPSSPSAVGCRAPQDGDRVLVLLEGLDRQDFEVGCADVGWAWNVCVADLVR